jgi:hypothetical protein
MNGEGSEVCVLEVGVAMYGRASELEDMCIGIVFDVRWCA